MPRQLTPARPSSDSSNDESSGRTDDTSGYSSNDSADAIKAEVASMRVNLGRHNRGDMYLHETGSFLSHYGPTESIVDPAAAVKCLEQMSESIKKDQVVVKRFGKYQWNRPKKLSQDTFKDIVDAILLEASPRKRCFALVPQTHLVGGISGLDYDVYACFADALYAKGHKLSIKDIHVPCVVETDRNPVASAQVHLRILAACHHLLNEDLRRMWTYGLTVEGSFASLWYFSRTHSVKSIAFNWIKDPVMLVRVLLSLSKATLKELGIDPRVHLCPEVQNDGTPSYVYETPANPKDEQPRIRFYRTGKCLSTQSPLTIACQITRVWEVTEVTSATGDIQISPGKVVVLKDVWLYKDAKTEAENMDAIFAAVKNLIEDELEAHVQSVMAENPGADRKTVMATAKTNETLMAGLIEGIPRFKDFDADAKIRLRRNLINDNYKSLFLKELHAWKGEVSKERGCDVQRYPAAFPEIANERRRVRSSESPKPKSAYRTHWHDPNKKSISDNKEPPRLRQCRFIYEEVCTTLHNLDNVGDVVDVLCGAIDALHILFAVGWVHRDLSSTNIMAFKQGDLWTVKLADLEFAQSVSSGHERESDSRIGTPSFMALEILRQTYIFQDFRYSDRVMSLLGTRECHVYSLANQLKTPATDGPEYQHLRCFQVLPFWSDQIASHVPAIPAWDKTPAPNCHVNHNYQHDLESIWWILLWIVSTRVHCRSSAAKSSVYFDNSVGAASERRCLMLMPIYGTLEFARDLDSLFTPLLEDLRRLMLYDYFLRPIYGNIDVPESYSRVQGKFASLLRQAQKAPGAWRMIPLKHGKKEPPPDSYRVIDTGRKRARNNEAHRSTKSKKPKHDIIPSTRILRLRVQRLRI